MFLREKIVLFPRNITTANYDGVTLRRLIPNIVFWDTVSTVVGGFRRIARASVMTRITGMRKSQGVLAY